MALFMELYEGAGLTVDAVRGAHAQEQAAAEKRGVRRLRYWSDPALGRVVSLVEAPGRHAVLSVGPGTLPPPEVTELFGSQARWEAVETVGAMRAATPRTLRGRLRHRPPRRPPVVPALLGLRGRL